MENTSRFVLTFLLNALWEVPVVLAVTQLSSIFLRKSPARYLHPLWVLALVLSFGLPFSSILPLAAFVSRLWPQSSLAPPTYWFTTYASLANHGESPAPRWLSAVFWIYLAFLGYRLLRFAWAGHQTRQLRRRSYAGKFPPKVLAMLDRCCAAYGIDGVSIRYSQFTRGPLALGVRSPLIILPEDVLRSASEVEWLSIFSHELAHIWRHDFLKNLAYEFLYWPLSIHPAARFIQKQIRDTRELACDELATESLINPDQYAQSLVSLAGLVTNPNDPRTPTYSLGIFDSNILEKRVMRLLQRRPTSLVQTKALLALMLVAITTSGITASAFAFRIDAEQAAADDQSQGRWRPDIPKVGGGISAPTAIWNPEAEYPKSGRASKTSGVVLLWCVIGPDGRVKETKIAKSLTHDFDVNAIAAVRKWKFKPALKDGKPTAVQINIQVDFRLY